MSTNTAAHHAVLSIFDGPLTGDDIWLIIGFLGQALFFGRFLVQWIVSEKKGRSVIPDVFWYFSLGGGLVLMVYAIHRQDPVFIMGQSVGLFVYVRNIMLVWRERRKTATTQPE
ncbi:MAG: lipid-A-disaccharide synthase N-terminal domain-containing protein [Alphaproteobacteria bacterium]|nr:lipid-A-disaccharide synthase N-terminal domain-containing protein [Alphaproteobacteria bacterium]